MAIEFKVSSPTQKVIDLALKTQDQLDEVSIQLASQEKRPDFAGYAKDGTVGSIVSFQEVSQAAEAYTRSNDLIISKNLFADQALEDIQNIASDVASLITKRRNSATGENLPVQSEAQALLDGIQGSLNVRFDGTFIFSGSKTNTQPVSSLTASNLNDNNEATANYYNGDSRAPSIKISESQEITYGVTADNQAFQDLIGAVHLLIEGDASGDDDLLGDAIDLVNDAISGLANTRAVVLSANENLKKANAVHSDVSLLVGENLTELTGTDIIEATTIMRQIEAQLQASFSTFSRLSNLRLSDFI